MEISKLKKYLVVRYVLLSMITAALISLIFFAFYDLSNSLQDKKNSIALLNKFKNSLLIIESSLEATISNLGRAGKTNLKNEIAVEIEKINFPQIYKLQQEYMAENLAGLIPNKIGIKRILVNIEELLFLDSGQSNKEALFQNLKRTIQKLESGINNLILAIALNQQEMILTYDKTNKLIWLGSLIFLQFLIIFLYRPMTKKITTETGLLQKEKETAIATARARSEFLATISHEIRTPLNGVLGLTGLLLETRISQEQKEYLELVYDSGESLLQVINDIFDFSKIESGNFKLEQMYFSIRTCIDSVVENFLPKAIEKNIQLLYLIESDVPDYILGDSKRTAQCLSNLVSNAVKFTRNGEIIIRANLINSIGNNYEIQFSISDTGIGIPESKLKNLFTPFNSEKAPAARRFEGIGLGLAICFRIVELMHGRIWVESEINKGSTFYFAANFVADNMENPDHAKMESGLLAEKHIFILDANETARKILSVQCHDWGMHPVASGSLDEMSEALKNNKNLSFALLDLDLIEKENDNVIDRIKSVAKEKNIHILFMRSSEKMKHSSQNFKDSTFLSKQVKQAQLYESLTDLVSKERPVKKGAPTVDFIDTQIPLSLLLAEDNIINQKLIERFISRIGYTIDVAQNGVQAVKMASVKNYNIIFMDLQMPEMDGIEATKKILSNQNETLKPKIIAMTAKVQTEDKELCFEFGMVDYISKPVSYEKVKHLIEYWGKISLEERSELVGQ